MDRSSEGDAQGRADSVSNPEADSGTLCAYSDSGALSADPDSSTLSTDSDPDSGTPNTGAASCSPNVAAHAGDLGGRRNRRCHGDHILVVRGQLFLRVRTRIPGCAGCRRSAGGPAHAHSPHPSHHRCRRNTCGYFRTNPSAN